MRDFILLFGLIIITDRKVKISIFSVDFLVSVHIKGNGIILLEIFFINFENLGNYPPSSECDSHWLEFFFSK